jgi:uncharacterized membrane protein
MAFAFVIMAVAFVIMAVAFVIMAVAFVIMALSGSKRHDHGPGPTANAMITKRRRAGGEPVR